MAVEARERLTLDDVLVIDADVHVHETPKALLPYIDPDWRPALENLTQVPHRYLNMPAFCPNPGSGLPGSSVGGSPKTRVEIVWDAEQMRRELDAFAIDIGLLFPDNFLKLAALPHAGYATALCQAYNRWLEAEWLNADNDLYGVLMVPPQDPQAAVREIERYAGRPRWVAVYLPTCQVYPLWGHRQYFPLMAAAEAAGLPVMLHAVSGMHWAFPYNLEQFTSAPTIHTASHVFAMMANLMNMLENGVPQRYPNLKVVFCEAGLTWVPFLRMRMDKEYKETRRQWPHLTELPSAVIERFYFATQPVEEPDNRQDLADLIRIYRGEETTLFASDWPHHDFDHPRAVFNLPVGRETKIKIMGENALRLFPTIRVPVKYQARYPQFADR
jgi:predicted TIM-barrel fold metal-dependent hydrolase